MGWGGGKGGGLRGRCFGGVREAPFVFDNCDIDVRVQSESTGKNSEFVSSNSAHDHSDPRIHIGCI